MFYKEENNMPLAGEWLTTISQLRIDLKFSLSTCATQLIIVQSIATSARAFVRSNIVVTLVFTTINIFCAFIHICEKLKKSKI